MSLLSAGIIARALGTEGFGRFSVGSALVGLTAPLADFGLRSLAVRELSRAGIGARRALFDLLSLRILLAVGTTAVTAAIALFVSPASGLAPVILVTSLTVMPVTIAGTLTDGLMARNRARAISSATFWAGILLTIASVIAALLWHSATTLAAAYVVGPVVNVVMLARQSRSEYGPMQLRWRPRYWRLLLRRAFPFFQVGILSAVLGRVDTIVVSSLFGQSAAGIFAAATSLADRLGILIDSVASAVLPTLTRLGAQRERLQVVLAEVMYPLLALLTAGSLAAMAGSTAAVTVIFGAAYASGGPVLAASLFFLPFNSMNVLLAEGFLAMRDDSFVVRTGVHSQVASVILIPVCAYAFGMVGARIGRIGVATSVVSRFRKSRRILPGLWSREHLRRFAMAVATSLPIPIVLLVHQFPPIPTVLIAGFGFLGWALLTARAWGIQLTVAGLWSGAFGNEPVAPVPPADTP